ncbi:MAG: ABC transporter permease [Bacteroidales bacterium]|nr:ABC transporter permease [Bacteroidales bacterium]
MRKLLFLLKKEFRQIRRNPFMARAIIAVPLIQMLILVPAITFEVKRIDLAVTDYDRSPASRGLISKLSGSSFFSISAVPSGQVHADELLLSGDADMVLIIPDGFAEAMAGKERPRVQVLADAVNATSAQLGWNYLSSVVRDYNRDVLISTGMAPSAIPGISVSPRFWYNPDLNYKYYMLPGILVILVTAIGLLMAGLNLVREKEIGTIEQINVTPVRKWELIASKVIPFFLIGLFDLALGLTVGWVAFDIPFEGSLLFLCLRGDIPGGSARTGALLFNHGLHPAAVPLRSIFFFVMIFILMSGIFTPSESMPRWAQQFNLVNPVAYLMRINRMVMLKGSGFQDIAADMGALALLAVTFITLAIRAYRKRA